jgi:predicted ribosomally synthesized peptide with SipW-like signal peptide
MSRTHVLKSAAVLLGAVIAALMCVSGTLALWSATAESEAGTITAADFSVTLVGANGKGAQMTLPNGTSASVEMAAGDRTLTPGKSVHAAVEVKNTTMIGRDFTIRASIGQPAVSGDSPQLREALSLTTAQAADRGSCPSAKYSSAPSSADIAEGESAVFCVRITLAEDAPISIAEQTATITLPITADQLERNEQ